MNIDIGTRRQLFFDNHIIEMVQTMTRRMHLPVKHESNPLIRKDRPWEQDPCFRTGTMCVAHDPDEKLYKCWYCDYAWDYQTFMANTPKAKPAATGARKSLSEAFMVSGFQFETTDNRWLYAESEDGIEWRKPELDYLEVDGRKTNICLGGGHHGEVYVACFFRDELEQDPARRFKSLHWRQLSEQLSVTESQIRVAHSADGRSWAGGEEPITVGRIRERRLGDEMMVLPDVETGQYLLTVRETAMGDRLSFRDQPVHLAGSWNSPYYPDNPLLMNKRRVFVTNSNRLDEWPTLRELLVPDDRYDNLDEAFYSLPVIRAGEYYVGFLNVFHAVDNTMDVQLLYSRNAYDWTRVERGRTFLGLEPRLLGPVHGRGRSLGDPGRRRGPHLLRRRRLPPRLVPVRRARGAGHAGRARRQQDGAGAGDAAARRVLLARLHRAAGAVRDPPVHQPRLRADRQRPLRTQGLSGGRAFGRRRPRRARLRTRRLPAVPR